MKTATISILALLVPAAALAADAMPDLKGTWSGPFRTVIFGNNPHHPGAETTSDAPRVREITYTVVIDGQDGNLLWGHEWTDPADKEPWAATVTPDGKTIVGADTDGALSFTITGPDQMNLCYTHTGLSPSKSIVASCGVLDRQK